MSDTWAAPEDDPRSYGNPVGETAIYREYLGNYRYAGHADLLRECIDGRTGQ